MKEMNDLLLAEIVERAYRRTWVWRYYDRQIVPPTARPAV